MKIQYLELSISKIPKQVKHSIYYQYDRNVIQCGYIDYNLLNYFIIYIIYTRIIYITNHIK
ncbi:hypothetical protein VCR8J2_60042 [Vibrio coralliirubri]|nr:hypothetical protein VCR8J2_60042 [Vibrio coralliirubri]